MSDKHPLIGVAYDVQTDDLPSGVPDATETIVPVGYDQYGNVKADHYIEVSDCINELLWEEDEFVEYVADDRLVEDGV